jgi:hypothetical protein
MAPFIHSLEAKYHDKMNFIYLDIDDPVQLETADKLVEEHGGSPWVESQLSQQAVSLSASGKGTVTAAASAPSQG